MRRILMITTSDEGRVNPMVGVAQHLVQMGHEVGWLSVDGPSPQLERLGVDVVRCDIEPRPEPRGEEFARLVEDPAALRDFLQRRLIDHVPEDIEPIRLAIGRWCAEAVALDPALYAAIFAVQQEALPYIGVSVTLDPVVHPTVDCRLAGALRTLRALRNALFAEHGLEPRFRLSELLSPNLTTVFATRCFLGSRTAMPAKVLPVGPAIPLGPRGDEPDDFPHSMLRGRAPLVYASFGARNPWQPDLYDLLVRACSDLGVRLVLSVGDLVETTWARSLPGYVLAVRYAPQLELLEKAAVFVTHGAAPSVMEALSFGVPMLALPIWNDQPLVGEFLRRSGTGLVIAANRATETAVRESLRALLTPAPSMESALARNRDACIAADGARVVATRLVEIAG